MIYLKDYNIKIDKVTLGVPKVFQSPRKVTIFPLKEIYSSG